MNKEEFYAQWTSALRSDEYSQGGGRLRMGSDYCCLGVACDILAKDGQGHWSQPSDGVLGWGFHPTAEQFIGIEGISYVSTAVLPERVAQWLGIGACGDIHWGYLADGTVSLESGLTELNDEGFTFEQIADVIDYFFAPKGVSLEKSL